VWQTEDSATFLPEKILEEKIRRFVEEDLGQGDITTLLTIPPRTIVEAEVVAKESGIAAGVEEALTLLKSFDLEANAPVSDGSKVEKETVILKVTGDARTLLSIERTLLNILTRMSGIATTTHKLVEEVKSSGCKARVACTRKVAPGLSYFDKRAVMLGGGDTHRLHLDDLVLIKDNHLAILGSIDQAVRKVRSTVSFSKKIEVEVSKPDEAVEAAKAGADIVMLDNFPPQEVRATITLLEKKGLRNKVLIEASGGINEQNILQFAKAGADILSLGELTDSAKALDINLKIVKVRKSKA